MKLNERRSYVRYNFPQEIQYINPDTLDEIASVIFDISDSGMCFYMFGPVKVGQEIIIQRRRQFYKKGVIVWFRKIVEEIDIYKVGLKFL